MQDASGGGESTSGGPTTYGMIPPRSASFSGAKHKAKKLSMTANEKKETPSGEKKESAGFESKEKKAGVETKPSARPFNMKAEAKREKTETAAQEKAESPAFEKAEKKAGIEKHASKSGAGAGTVATHFSDAVKYVTGK
jgi:hypothetical protein